MKENKTQTGLNPLTAMWSRPKAAITQVLTTDSQQSYRLLFILLGLYLLATMLLDPAKDIFTKYPIWFTVLLILPIYALGALLAAWITVNINGFITKLIGGWLGGKGSFKTLKIASLWGIYPTLIIGLFGILLRYVLHQAVYGELVMPVIWICPLILLNGFYGIILSANAFSVAHEFSLKRGFILALILFVPMLLLQLLSMSVLMLYAIAKS